MPACPPPTTSTAGSRPSKRADSRRLSSQFGPLNSRSKAGSSRASRMVSTSKPRRLSSAVVSTQATGASPEASARFRRSSAAPVPILVSNRSMASMVSSPARSTKRGAARSSSIAKSLAPASCTAASNASTSLPWPLTVRMRLPSATISRQWLSARNSAPSAAASPAASAVLKRFSQASMM